MTRSRQRNFYDRLRIPAAFALSVNLLAHVSCDLDEDEKQIAPDDPGDGPEQLQTFVDRVAQERQDNAHEVRP